VRAAAAALVVTEPSVSAAVASLEREIGAALVERSGRGLRITPAGEELARFAGEALGLIRQGVDAARGAARPGTGRLRLAAVTTAGEYIVPVVLRAFRLLYPDVEPFLEVGNRALVLSRVASRDADLGIGGRPPPGRDVAGVSFLPNELILVAHPHHPLARRRRVETAELSDETWLLREPGSGTRATTEEFLASMGITPRSVLTIGSNGAVKQAAAVGLGVTLISAHAVQAELESRSLSRLRGRGLPLQREWYALHPERGPLPDAARLFVDFLRSPAARRLVPSSPRTSAGSLR
jgi:DNA-binding transcriptional LysR family regulator